MANKLTLRNFSNKIAFEIANRIINRASEEGLKIAVDISRLNQQVFFYLDDGLAPDKNDWIKRKSNTAKRFMVSSLEIQEKCCKDNSTLCDKYGLANNEFVAVGGSVPIFVKDVGLIGTITVTGLKPEEDHQLIIDVVSDYLEEVKDEI